MLTLKILFHMVRKILMQQVMDQMKINQKLGIFALLV